MANKIDIELNLKNNLKELDKIRSTPELKLTKQQQAAYDKHRAGAETALANNDLAAFRQYFNSMTEILKKASAVSGKISKNLQELTDKQEKINKDIQKLTETRDALKKSITSSKGEGTLSKKKANELLSGFSDKDKIIGKSGNVLNDASVINARVQKLAQDLEAAGKTWSQITNEIAQAAGFKDKGSAQAAHRFYESEQKYISDTQKQISSIDAQISDKQAEEIGISKEIENIKNITPESKQALDDLYATLMKIKNSTNTQINEAQTAQRQEEAGAQPGTSVDSIPLVEGLKKQETSLGKAFKQFTIYQVALRAVKRALREAVQTVKELDKELTEQAMVTGLTREQTYKLVKSYQDLAQQTGATTKEIAGVATEYMKQGKSIQEAMTLTEAAVSAAKVARVSTADSVNYLTTALNGFQLSANDAMLVSDKFAAVAAASATDYDELAIALSKVASQANLAGMSIDYTTALLTKGLETTREAPETMGTALKTIIARMRELSDYGETLEGDTDINNVETQLGYVGIALRNTAGELRSTEDVLDELGKKWDTLNKNQQAAVAKALAGTRQQSRLIAMMSDYERVIELQEIAQRSAGATAAQAGVYLEGIEASMNKITIAWEKIVTSITDSTIIINLLNFVSDSLEFVGAFLATDWGLISTLTVVGTLVAQVVGAKIRETMYAKTQQQLERERLKIQLKIQKSGVEDLKTRAEALANRRKETALLKLNRVLEKEGVTEAEVAAAEAAYKLECDNADLQLEADLLEIKQHELTIDGQLQALDESRSMHAFNIASSAAMTVGGLGSMVTKSGSLLAIMTVVSTLLQAMPALITLATKAQEKHNKKTLIGALLAEAEGLAKFWPWGVFAAAALLALVGIGVAISNTSSKTEDSAEQVNKLSNEIYKLQEKANAIDQITTAFDELDNKIIQTNKDIEEMGSLLEQAADKLSDETTEVEWYTNWLGQRKSREVEITKYGGKSEKEYYQTLDDNSKLEFLRQLQEESRAKGKQLRDDQIQLFRDNPELLNKNTSNASIKQAQTSIYANAVYNLQEYIDKLKESEGLHADTADAIEKMTEAMIREADIEQALNYGDYEKQVADLVDDIKNLYTQVEDTKGELQNISLAEILTSDDYGIRDKARAFNELKQELGESSEEYQLLAVAYKDYETFAKMGDDVLKMVEYLELSIEDINQLGKSYKTLKSYGLDMSEEAFKNSITGAGGVLDTLAKTGGDVESTVKQVFRTVLSSADDYEKTYNAIINSLSSVLSRGMLNMGQDVTKLKNTVNGFYEKATEWQSMTASEQSEFMSENAHLFEGKDGEDLLAALNSGDFRDMERLLKESDAMQKQIEDTLKWIDTELSVEEAKIEDARNEAYINQLKKWRGEIEDQTNFFRADLEFLIEQEQAQLNIYKDFLEKQQEQLEEALDKRKQAYEDYFEAINQQQEDEDYQEQSDKLVANLSKLSTSTDMASQKQAKQLEQQLEELEKERQQTLRERAQEAVINSIDQEVEDINDKFDKLLDNSQLLLEAMRGEVNSNPQLWTELMASARESGMTNLQLEEFGNELLSAFGSDMTNVDLKEIQETITNNATINVGDRTYDLNSDDGDAFWNLLQAIMSKNGYS